MLAQGLEGTGEGEEELHEGGMDEAGRVEVREGQAQPPDRPRVTTRYMTKYERARVLGTRALQIR